MIESSTELVVSELGTTLILGVSATKFPKYAKSRLNVNKYCCLKQGNVYFSKVVNLEENKENILNVYFDRHQLLFSKFKIEGEIGEFTLIEKDFISKSWICNFDLSQYENFKDFQNKYLNENTIPNILCSQFGITKETIVDNFLNLYKDGKIQTIITLFTFMENSESFNDYIIGENMMIFKSFSCEEDSEFFKKAKEVYVDKEDNKINTFGFFRLSSTDGYIVICMLNEGKIQRIRLNLEKMDFILKNLDEIFILDKEQVAILHSNEVHTSWSFLLNSRLMKLSYKS